MSSDQDQSAPSQEGGNQATQIPTRPDNDRDGRPRHQGGGNRSSRRNRDDREDRYDDRDRRPEPQPLPTSGTRSRTAQEPALGFWSQHWKKIVATVVVLGLIAGALFVGFVLVVGGLIWWNSSSKEVVAAAPQVQATTPFIPATQPTPVTGVVAQAPSSVTGQPASTTNTAGQPAVREVEAIPADQLDILFNRPVRSGVGQEQSGQVRAKVVSLDKATDPELGTIYVPNRTAGQAISVANQTDSPPMIDLACPNPTGGELYPIVTSAKSKSGRYLVVLKSRATEAPQQRVEQ